MLRSFTSHRKSKNHWRPVFQQHRANNQILLFQRLIWSKHSLNLTPIMKKCLTLPAFTIETIQEMFTVLL